MNKIILTLILTLLPLTLLPFGFLSAQDLSGSDAPVEISADQALEWRQKDLQYVALGAVEATQGDVTIFAEKLVADYRENKDDKKSNGTGNTEIWQLTATKNVRIKNIDSTATGDKAVYDVDSGQATLTGQNLKLTTPDQVITAQQSMEYNANKGIAKAIGNAKIIEGTDTLSANTITANFEKDKTGKQVLKSATAIGRVVITTPDETLTGDRGVYNAKNNTAEVTGNVKIVRGPNILEGARAEVNLNTNLSKMFGAPETGTRVKGIFFPSSKKSDQKDTE